jgi:hypothetical protein
MFWVVLALFVVTDIIVIAVVVRRMSPALRMLGLPGGTNRNRILASAHTVVGEYLRANYSGDPGQLATALRGLLPQVREHLRSNGVEPEPEVVRALVEVSAARHRVATPRQLREALATVA